MNVLFSLTPKEKVAYIFDDYTVRQALEKMDFHQYTAVPIIDSNGRYVGILREGDILRYIKEKNKFDLDLIENVRVKDIPRQKDNVYANITAEIKDLVDISINQNFIPVIDDRKLFIGIVTRKDIILYLKNKQQ